MLEGQHRTVGRAWEKSPPRCCKMKCCQDSRSCQAILKSPSLQILSSHKGTVLEWCLTGAKNATFEAFLY
jgi:hypothetical protein